MKSLHEFSIIFRHGRNSDHNLHIQTGHQDYCG